jgi:hypothetical protein
MGGINTGRVLLGGLVAGVILNVSETVLNVAVMGNAMQAAMIKLGLPMPAGGTIGIFIVLCLLLGLVSVWLYAAIRPRLGPGPKTASIAAVVVWFLANLYPTIGEGAMGFFAPSVLVVTSLWGLVELLIAVNVGAYLYKE